MATARQGKGAIGLGRRLTNQIWAVAATAAAVHGSAPLPLAPGCAAARRGVHIPSYDKNGDDHVRPSAVPDDLVQPQSEKYWGPHPTTGVFGPAEKNARSDPAAAAAPANDGGTVLDQTSWFRPQEDVDDRPHA